jgi:DNA-binding PadR family transcriptional regulator
MPQTHDPNLFARLAGAAAGPGAATDKNNPWKAVAATTPSHESAAGAAVGKEDKLNGLLQRINQLAAAPQSDKLSPGANSQRSDSANGSAADEFVPCEPATLDHAGLSEAEVESLVLKYLLARGSSCGRDIADQVKLPFALIEGLLRQLKSEQLVVYRSSTVMNDYIYQLTDLGRERSQRYSAHCTYFGAAPVSLTDYIASVRAQSLSNQHPTQDALKQAFADLLINPHMLDRLGPAVNSGRGLFLYGSPGNGKTSIAERITRAFGQYIWIPRAIGVDGEIVRLFDPVNHEEAPPAKCEGWLDQSKIDKRWVRIRRPTIIVAGELTMENLEVSFNPATGISEAPVQLKSNCGTLVIDDFGRQRMSVHELLNRWIVPLEKRYDFLNLSNGKKLQVPFDQLIVFSTNLEPKDLVDEAFLRRIPYKIEVLDPTEDEFRDLFKLMCPKLNFEFRAEAVEYLIQRHYKAVDRPFRCCQPRDLLLQVRSHCRYQNTELELKPEYFDFAAENYFAVM